MKLQGTPTQSTAMLCVLKQPGKLSACLTVSQPAIRFGMSQMELEFFVAVLEGRTEELLNYLKSDHIDVNMQDDDGWTPLIVASVNGHYETAKILLNHGGDVNAKTLVGTTALMFAAANGHDKIVKLLLDADADVDAKTISGRTAAKCAEENLHFEILELLLNPSRKPVLSNSSPADKNTITVPFGDAISELMATLNQRMDKLKNTKQ
jgi:uncharacterized protein